MVAKVKQVFIELYERLNSKERENKLARPGDIADKDVLNVKVIKNRSENTLR